jgi:hypothetical protein
MKGARAVCKHLPKAQPSGLLIRRAHNGAVKQGKTLGQVTTWRRKEVDVKTEGGGAASGGLQVLYIQESSGATKLQGLSASRRSRNMAMPSLFPKLYRLRVTEDVSGRKAYG